jgi:carbonic anhydrase
VEQVVKVCQTTIVQDAWDRGQPLTVHGWVYGLKDGHLHDLEMTVSAGHELASRLESRLGKYAATA